ncbi:MAG: hypothetical protein KL863_09130 [Rhizobium sp.]|nr:hypothetical protein [Rhizobium sp.]
MKQQLDFFAVLDVVKANSGTVITFRPRRRPSSRRRNPSGGGETIMLPSWRLALTRTAAVTIVARPPEKQWWHRRDQLNHFRRQLRAAGLASAAVDLECKLFQVNLESEMRRAIILQIIAQQHG